MKDIRAVARVAVFGAALLLLAAPASAQLDLSTKVGLITYGGLHTMDLVTTAKSDSRGAVDLNPLYRTSNTNRALMAAGNVALTTYLAKRLGTNHPKLVKGLVWTFVGGMAAVQANNLRWLHLAQERGCTPQQPCR